MFKQMIPIMAFVKKWRGKICLAFLFRFSLFQTNAKVQEIKLSKRNAIRQNMFTDQ